jgi:hypothetical protein
LVSVEGSLQRNPHAGETEKLEALIGRPLHDFSALNDELEGMKRCLCCAPSCERVGIPEAPKPFSTFDLGGQADPLSNRQPPRSCVAGRLTV